MKGSREWRGRLGLGTLLAAWLPLAGHAQVYATLDQYGQLQVSPAPVQGAMRFDPGRTYAPRPPAMATPERPHRRGASARQRWTAMVEQVAAEYAVDARLLHAVIQVESNYNAAAHSPAGALGLMQVIPSTGRRFGARDLLDPLQNLRAGTAYLVWLDRHFGGDLSLVLAAYNAGEGAVRRHGRRIPPYAETQSYVKRVRQVYSDLSN